MRTLIVDNYDSYTFNLYQAISQINGELPVVVRNDRILWEDLIALNVDNVVISPGPGRPEKPSDFGICQQIIEQIDVPLLGVCLGHQGIGYFCGGRVIHAPEVRHGRLSNIYHGDRELFRGIPSPFSVVRYHSLLVADPLPDCLEKIAWTEDGLVMGLRHRTRPIWGVQFHPESIGTEYGQTLLENFKQMTEQLKKNGSIGPKTSKWIGYGAVSPNLWQPNSPPDYTVEIVTRKLDICPDTETLFVQLFGEAVNAFWLDSSRVESGLSRFSFMGDGDGENSVWVRYDTETQELMVTQSETVTSHRESIFEYLQREIDRNRCQTDELPFDFNGGFVGYFGYELKAECGGEVGHSSTLPDALFLRVDRLIAIDHQEECVYLVHRVKSGQTEEAETWCDRVQQQLEMLQPLPPSIAEGNGEPVEFHLSRSHSRYLQDIQQCLQEIHEGETYQVCLTNQLMTDSTPHPLNFYRRLRQINPAPYAAFFRIGEMAIACSSPERFLRIDRHGWVETKPIKGTERRGTTEAEDFFLKERLRQSEKDRSENLMITDLLRNDLGQVCEVGTVRVSKLMDIETYATVHQMVTTVRGHLRPDLTALDCIRMAFPGGSMTGAPKLRTLEIIDRLEQEARGVYSGAIGFLGWNGSADLNIAIRTAVLTGNRTSIGIGGAIVALSDPQMEFQETLLKAKALIEAMVLTLHGTIEGDRHRLLGLEIHNYIGEKERSSEKIDPVGFEYTSAKIP